MKLIVVDRASVEMDLVAIRPPYVVISVHDPDRRPPRIPKKPGLRDVLCLGFDDAVPSGASPIGTSVPMTEDHAQQVCAFVRKWSSQVETVVVHCEQGVSRSPAVAAALSKCLGLDESEFYRFYYPNPHVYLMVAEAWVRTSPPS